MCIVHSNESEYKYFKGSSKCESAFRRLHEKRFKKLLNSIVKVNGRRNVAYYDKKVDLPKDC